MDGRLNRFAAVRRTALPRELAPRELEYTPGDMDWLYWLALLFVSVLGVILAVVGLPGIWLIVAATGLYAWITGGEHLLWCLGVLIVMGVVAEVIEGALGGVAARGAGGSKRSILGAIAGGVVGAIVGTPLIPIPVVGTVIGACVGSFAGAFGVELLWVKKSKEDALKVGAGAAAGKLAGIVVKLLFGAGMAITAIVWTLPIFAPVTATPLFPTSLPVTLPATVPALPEPDSTLPTTAVNPTTTPTVP
jgi:uncharacterized protein YqgC (DUF456 family)